MRPLLILTALFALAMSVALVASGDSPGLGNGVYTVFVEDQQGADGVGAFTVMTGPDHPAGEGQEVLFNRDGPGDGATSYLTVRSYTTGVDYVQTTADVYSTNIIYPLDPFGVTEAVDEFSFGVGYRTSYQITEYDSLRIESTARVTVPDPFGVTVLGAAVTNTGTEPVQIGLRMLLDLAPGGDDGPLIRGPGLDGDVLSETAFPRDQQFVNVIPNDGNRDVAISVDGRQDQTTGSAFVSWPEAFESAFDYTPSGRDIASPGSGGDAALLFYSGGTPDSSTTLAPGASLFWSILIREPREICDNGVDDDGDGEVDEDEGQCHPGEPTPTPAPGPGSSAPTPTPAMTPAELPHTGGRRR